MREDALLTIVAGLAETRRALGIESGLILTYAQREQRAIGDWKIPILPVWEWLLHTEPEAER